MNGGALARADAARRRDVASTARVLLLAAGLGLAGLLVGVLGFLVVFFGGLWPG